MADEHIVNIGIDIRAIKEQIKKELKEELEESVEEEIRVRLSEMELPDEVNSRLEKLEDWKLDIEQGYINLLSEGNVCKIETKEINQNDSDSK